MTTLVQTANGQVQGQQQGAITVWKGIPFAAPPTGKRRFLPPLPAQSWSGVLDATHFGPISMQSNGPLAGENNVSMSEDCLTLNVWSPGADQKGRPVMVYIHGGAFVTGSGSQSLYDGSSFAEKHDIVVVTCNYRLGLLGFLYLGDLAGGEYAQGNCALLDQIAALHWVRDNIAAFGGDPKQVTIMGESAGAMTIGALLSMPAAKGLFQRAILESGAASSSLIPRERATKLAQTVLAKLNLSDSQVLALNEIPSEALVNVQAEIASERGALTVVAPVIDGVTLPNNPLQLIDEGQGSLVPLLLGTNHDEWNLFTTLLGMSIDQVKVGLQYQLGEKAELIHQAYTQAREDKSADQAWVDMQGDHIFRIPAILQAERQLQHASVWMYRFDWLSPAMSGLLGACHALELPFVWNSQDPFAQFLLGDAITNIQSLIDRIHTTWATFIRTGNPNNPAIPDWPTYTLTQRPTMILNEESQVVEQPQAELLPLWTGIV